MLGSLDWNGVGFVCPSNNTGSNNVLGLPTTPCPLPFGPVHNGRCGPYLGNLTCTEDGNYLISVLKFKAKYAMNGGTISCQLNDITNETFPVRVGGKLNFICLLSCFTYLYTCNS